MMKSRCRESARKGKRERDKTREEREDAREREEKGKRERLSGAMGKERDSSPIVSAPPLLSTSRFPFTVAARTHTHTRFSGMNQIIG